MHTARRRLVVYFVLFLSCFAALGLLDFAQESPRRSAKSEDSFDAPLKQQVVDCGPSTYYIGGSRRNELSCYFYSTFMVKQYDEGQKGSEWLAIAPVKGRTPPPCALSHGPAEKVITYPEWSGYFMGAKGRLVFFREADGINAGMPFVVYDSQTGAKLFAEDSYHDTGIFNMKKVESSPFNHMRVFEGNGQFSLKYLRVEEANCDLHSEKSSCWESVRKRLELQKTEMPVCTRYKGITSRLESAVAYPVEVTLFPKPVIKTVAGPVRCWPVD